MTKNAIDQQIIYLDGWVDRLQKVIDLLKEWKHPEACPGQLCMCSGEVLNIRIKNLPELHKARQFLKAEYGTWKDKLDWIWASSGQAHITWNGQVGDTTITIWMSCPVEEFPEELHKTDTCGFKKVSHSELSYVCEKGE